jgi:hypothetical protein
MKVPRRMFVRGALLTTGAAWLPWGDRLLWGNPLGLAAGVQLWSVREQLKENLDGTLRQLAAIGYREVELFETPKSPGEFRRKVEDAGLKCVSGHFELKDLKDSRHHCRRTAARAHLHDHGLSRAAFARGAECGRQLRAIHSSI